MKDQFKLIDPKFINPYALGYKINHPPPNTPANVVLLDLVIPNHFFPVNFMKYMPYIKYSNDNVIIIYIEYKIKRALS